MAWTCPTCGFELASGATQELNAPTSTPAPPHTQPKPSDDPPLQQGTPESIARRPNIPLTPTLTRSPVNISPAPSFAGSNARLIGENII